MHRAIPPDLTHGRHPVRNGAPQHEAIGDLHLAADNFSGAAEEYLAALREVGPNEPAERCRVLERLARAETRRGEYERARRALREARHTARLLDDPLVIARIAAGFAHVAAQVGQYQRGRRYGLFAYRRLRNSDDHQSVGRVEVTIGLCAARLGKTAEAIDWLQSAAATFRRIEDPDGLVTALNNLGLVYKNLREWREATRYLEQAMRLDERAGLYSRMLAHSQNLGIIRLRLGQWDLAEENFRTTLRIARETGYQQGEAAALLATGLLARRRRQSERAEEHYKQALELATKVGARREAILAREFLGELLLDKGEGLAALGLLEPALEEAISLAPNGDLVVELENRLGLCLLMLERREEAQVRLTRALTLAEGLADRSEVAFAQRALARVEAARGNVIGMESNLTAAERAYEELGETCELALTLAARAECMLMLPTGVRLRISLEPASDAAKRAAALFRQLSVPAAAAEAMLTLARLMAEREHYDQAVGLLENAEQWLAEAKDPETGDRAKTLRREIERQYVAVSLSTCNEFRALEEANRLFRETSDMDGLLAQIVKLAVENTGGDRGFVAFSGGGRLDVVASHGLGRDRGRRILTLIEGLDDSRILDSGPLFSSRVTADPRFAQGLGDALEGVGSLVCVPLHFPSQSVGLVYVDRLNDNLLGAFKQRELNLLAVLSTSAAVAIVEAQRSVLLAENRELRGRLKPSPGLDRVITESREMHQILRLISKVGDSNATVLFMGETGTGKGLLAKSLHEVSNRRDRQFVQVNCAALPEQLLESELFGYVQGAFTGALRDKVGLFEEAQGGTIFLDEIEKVPETVQAKLLHVLDTSEIRPLGATRSRKVDVRVVCATGCDLRDRIREGRFLEDLYYRLNDISIRVPALRERREDVPILAQHFLEHYGRQMEKRVAGFSPAVMKTFMDAEWRGNVRELEKTVKRLLVLADEGDTLDVDLLPVEMRPSASDRAATATATATGNGHGSLRSNVSELERRMIAEALERNGWNKARVARELGLSYPTLLSKIRLFGILKS